MTSERWLTVKEVSERIGVREDTIRKYLRSGALQGKRLGFRAGWRVSESQLNEFMGGEKEHRRPDEPDGGL